MYNGVQKNLLTGGSPEEWPLLKAASAFFAVFSGRAFSAPVKLDHVALAALGADAFNPGLLIVVGVIFVHFFRKVVLLICRHR